MDELHALQEYKTVFEPVKIVDVTSNTILIVKNFILEDFDAGHKHFFAAPRNVNGEYAEKKFFFSNNTQYNRSIINLKKHNSLHKNINEINRSPAHLFISFYELVSFLKRVDTYESLSLNSSCYILKSR